MTGIVAPARIAPSRPAASRKSRSATPAHVARSVAITRSGVGEASTRATSSGLRFTATSSMRNDRLTIGRPTSGRRMSMKRRLLMSS